MTIYYTKDHEWIKIEGDKATVGISQYAQEQLGDVVFVELPEMGATLTQGEEACVVESVKTASEVYAPMSGLVTSVNETLADNPAIVNEDALGQGWFFTMTLSQPAQVEHLMPEQDYQNFIQQSDT